MDKYITSVSLYLIHSNLNFTEDFKLNRYQNFQLILQMCFHFMNCFVNSTIFRMFIYWSRLWKIENARNIHISSKVSQSRMWNSACIVITHGNTSKGIKILTFLEKVGEKGSLFFFLIWKKLLNLSSAPLSKNRTVHLSVRMLEKAKADV